MRRPVTTPAATRICGPWHTAARGLLVWAKWRTICSTRSSRRRYSGAAAGDQQGIILRRLHSVEVGIELEVVPSLFAVRLVALEVVDGRSHELARPLAGTYGVDLVSDHEKHLVGNHHFIVLYEIADEHQDLLGGHWLSPRITRNDGCRMPPSYRMGKVPATRYRGICRGLISSIQMISEARSPTMPETLTPRSMSSLPVMRQLEFERSSKTSEYDSFRSRPLSRITLESPSVAFFDGLKRKTEPLCKPS